MYDAIVSRESGVNAQCFNFYPYGVSRFSTQPRSLFKRLTFLDVFRLLNTLLDLGFVFQSGLAGEGFV